jgi:hypothetical protein
MRAILSALLLLGFLLFSTGCRSSHPPSVQTPALSSSDGKKEGSGLDILLSELKLKRRDLGIHRSLPSDDPFLLNKVPLFLNAPLQALSFANQCAEAFGHGEKSLSSLIKVSAGLLELEIDPLSRQKAPFPEDFSKIPPSPLRQAVEILYPALAQANKLFTEAFDGLSKEEAEFCRRTFESFLFPNGEDKGLPRYKNQEEMEKAVFLASGTDRGRMLKAAYIVASALDEALKLLNQLDPSQMENLTRERIVLRTPLGQIVIGGSGDDLYSGKMPLLLIELGGNDQYRFEEYSPLGVLIDLSGDDQYYSSKTCWLGAGILGLGFLIDQKGNDIYRGDDFSFGTGFFGVGLLFDGQGNDRYISGIFSQGAGAMGLGILCDIEGDDRYQTVLCGQGFGFVGGGGLLLDYRGNDTFIAGGVIPDHREASNAFETLSQGFGFGIRPFASGGLGILYDGAGDDLYEGSYFSQGSAYWLSIGLLIDKRGNDLYKARRYSQGAGTHWAVGALTDYEGNDRYSSWGVSQGCGHDRSVGILWDGQGNDRYSAEWLSQGAGNDTGIGLLIDERGDDVYEAGKDGTTQGFGNFDARRDEGSLGFLVDGGGEDVLSGKGKERNLWGNGRWGGGIDYKGFLAATWKEPFRRVSRVSPPRSFKFKTYEEREWDRFILTELEGPLITEESWKGAAAALAKRGPSVTPSLLKYLEINDSGVQGVLEETFKRLGRKNVEKLLLDTESQAVSKRERRFLLYLLGEMGKLESKEIFLKFLREDDPSLQAMALRGLYKVKTTPSPEEARSLSKSKNPDVRRYLCLSLQTGQDAEFIPILVELSKDADFNVRFAAAEGLRRFGAPLRN